jgi:hypothetical protein
VSLLFAKTGRWLATTVCMVGHLQLGRADVEIHATGGCLDARAVRARLEVIAGRTRGGSLDVRVAERVAPDGSAEVSLRVLRTQRVVLDRQFQLAPSECASATALLGVVLDRLVTELPVEGWAAEPRVPARPVAVELPAAYQLVLVSAASVEGAPLGGDLELGARLDRGRAWRVGGGLLLRESLPSDLGRGTVIATTTMAAAGARYVGERWSAGLELRGGGMRLMGRGFAENRTSWVPWAEAAASVLWVGRRMEIGVVLSGSPLGYRALLVDGMEVTEISRFRVGIGVSVPLWERP